MVIPASRPASPRTMPEKVTTAPAPSARTVKAFVSAPGSKASDCTRMSISAPGHRWKERNFPDSRQRRVEARKLLVQRHANRRNVLKGIGIAFFTSLELVDEIRDRLRRALDRFTRASDPLAQPGEIEHLDHRCGSFRSGTDFRK